MSMRAGYPGRMGPPNSSSVGSTLFFSLLSAIPNSTTFTRASVATYYNSAGTSITATANTPRSDYNPTTLAQNGLLLEESRTNSIRNSSMTGAGTGTLPTGWTRTLASGITETIGTTTLNGITYLSIRLQGTPAASPILSLNLGAATNIAAAQNEVWAYAMNLAVSAGSTTNVSSITLRATELAADGTTITAGNIGANIVSSLTSSVQRISWRDSLSNEYVTLSGATTAYVRPNLTVSWTSGAVDITLLIGAPQLEKGTGTSTFPTTWIPTTSAAVTRALETFVYNTAPAFIGSSASAKVSFSLPRLPPSGVKATLFQLDDGTDTAANRIQVAVEDGRVRIYTATTYTSVGTYTAGTVATVEVSWNGTFAAGRLNNGTIYDLYDATPSSFTTLRFGNQVTGGTLNGYLRSVAFYSTAYLIPSRTQLTLNSSFSGFPYNVYVADQGFRSATSYNFDAQKPTGGATYYVDSTNGSDANSGLTTALPLSTIETAINKADVGRIVLMSTTYDRTKITTTTHTLARDLVIETLNGITATLLGSDQNVSWTQNGTYPAVYQRTRNNVLGVFDAANLDSNGDPTVYTNVASIADCAALAGSWYNDGTIQYVRTLDGRVPDNNLHVQLSVTGFKISGQYKLWMENINFLGVPAVEIANTGASTYITAHLRNVSVKLTHLTTPDNGFTILGSDTYMTNCTAANNGLDGFNYHIYLTRKCVNFENSCIGRHNGKVAGASNNNGTTTHDGCTAIRINGQYYSNQGPNYADVDNDTRTLGVNCIMTGPTNTSGNKRNIDCGGGTAIGYYVHCQSLGTVDFDTQSGSGSLLRYFGSQTFTNTGGGITKVATLGDLML